MKSLARLTLWLAAFLCAAAAHAQSACPNGPGPSQAQVGTAGGVPMCQDTDGGGGGGDGTNWIPPPPVNTWAALVFSSTPTGYAIWAQSTDMTSREDADQDAIQNCIQQGGGKDCSLPSHLIELSADSPANQCVVVSSGDTKVGMGYGPASDLDAVEQRAMQECSKVTTHCIPVYNLCAWEGYPHDFQKSMHSETEWGAFVVVPKLSGHSSFGHAANMLNREMADQVAIKDCVAKGGKYDECSLPANLHETHNECVVLAQGHKGMQISHGQGYDMDTIKQQAIQECSKRTTKCKLFYADCEGVIQPKEPLLWPGTLQTR